MWATVLTGNQRVLVVAQLTVQSTYLESVERPAEPDRFDTLQWWIGPRRTWRVRTFAADRDIHLHDVAAGHPEAVELARATVRRHYGDVLGREAVVEFADYRDAAEVAATLGTALGAGRLEVAEDLELAFWNPGGARYRSRSRPAE